MATRIDLIITIALGILAFVLATVLGSGSQTMLLLGMLGVVTLPIVLWIRNADLTSGGVVALVAFTIPINLDVNLLYRAHTGGAPSITINVTLIALLLFFVVWIYRSRVDLQINVLRFHRPLCWSVVLLLAVTPLSAINANDLELVVLEWIRLVFLAIAMMATMSFQNDRFVRIWIFILSIQVVVQAALAGAQYFTGQTLGLAIFGEAALIEQRLGVGKVVNRATGTIGHPNILAYFFEILVPVFLALTLTRAPIRYRVWYGLACLAGLFGMITTLSRGAWLTVPVSFVIVFFFIVGQKIVRVRSTVAIALLGCSLMVPVYFAYPTIEKRFTHTDYKSSGSRVPLNKAAWSLVEEYPWFGVGLNNMAEVFKREDTTGLARTFHGVQHVVHNMHLWTWVETGTLGLLAFTAPFLIAMWTAIKVGSRAPPVPKAILVGLAAGLLAHLIHGMLDPGFRISLSISMLVFTSFGLIGHFALTYPIRDGHPQLPSKKIVNHVKE